MVVPNTATMVVMKAGFHGKLGSTMPCFATCAHGMWTTNTVATYDGKASVSHYFSTLTYYLLYGTNTCSSIDNRPKPTAYHCARRRPRYRPWVD